MAVGIVEESSGNIISIPHGGIANLSNELAESLIHDGIAEAYTTTSPTGTVSITENGAVDVFEYASANVNVQDPNADALIDGSITSIQIPNGVTSIGDGAFSYCSELTNATIPNSVTSIGNYPFSYCSMLTSVTVEATTPPTLGSSVFSGTHANLVIYVPAESVDTYKAASGWSTYADKIQAISS